MAMKRYGADFTDLTVNGLPIDEFGDSDPPFRRHSLCDCHGNGSCGARNLSDYQQ